MLKPKLLTSLLLLGSVSAWAQTTAPATTHSAAPATAPSGEHGFGEGDFRAKWEHMTPQEKRELLKLAEWVIHHREEANADDNSSDSPSTSSNGSQGTSSGTGSTGLTGTGSTTSGTTPNNSPATTSTTASTGTPASTTTGSTTPQEKWSQMTPEQKEAFLKSHPAIAEKFAQNHPDAEQRLAQTNEAGPGINDPGHPRVNEVNGREAAQQKRIAQGVSSGKLTPEEQGRLQRSGYRIEKQEGNDLAKNDGHLTPEEKARLNREENRRSRHINEDKHEQNNHEQNHE